MILYTHQAVLDMDGNAFTNEPRMWTKITGTVHDMNLALINSQINMRIDLQFMSQVSTGWGGAGQGSRHVVEVFLRGRSDVAIFL